MDEIELTDVTALIIVQKLENKTRREPPQRHGLCQDLAQKSFVEEHK